MAKQNKINKKRAKRRARNKSVKRQDYRQGGRVALHGGGHNQEREPGSPPVWIPHNPNDPNHFDGPNNPPPT